MRKIECSTGEIVYNYKDYLNTKHWRLKKNEYSREYENKCCMCESTKNLNLHHMTYENIGHENLNDLCYLCKDCHNALHKMLEDTKLSSYLKNFREKKINKKLKYQKCDCMHCFHRRGKACEIGFLFNSKTHCKYYIYQKPYGTRINPKKKKKNKMKKGQIIKIEPLPKTPIIEKDKLSEMIGINFRMELLTDRYKRFNTGVSIKKNKIDNTIKIKGDDKWYEVIQ